MPLNLSSFGRSLVEGSKPKAGIELTPELKSIIDESPEVKKQIPSEDEERTPTIADNGRTLISPKPTITQNILNSPVGDVLTLGMSKPEMERAVAKRAEEQRQAAEDFKATFKPNPDVQPVVNTGMNVLNTLFAPAIATARGIGGLAIPEAGKSRIQSALKDIMYDPGVGVYGQRIRDKWAEPKTPQEAEWQGNVAGTMGFLSELASFNPRKAVEALKSSSATKMVEPVGKIMEDAVAKIDKELPKIKTSLKEQFPDNVGDIDSLTSSQVIELAKVNPSFGDIVGKITKDKTMYAYAGVPAENVKKVAKAIVPEIPKEAAPIVGAMKPTKSEEQGIKNKTYIHETNAPEFEKFDLSKVGSGQGEAWLGQGIYLHEKGGLKFEKYGKNKIETALSPEANIFEVKDTPNGLYRDNFVQWAVDNNIGNARQLAEEANKRDVEQEQYLSITGRSQDKQATSKKNILPRDILKNRPDVTELMKKAGFDGLYQDGELVVYNPDIIRINKNKYPISEIKEKLPVVNPGLAISEPDGSRPEDFATPEEYVASKNKDLYQHVLRQDTDVQSILDKGFEGGAFPNAMMAWEGKPTNIVQMKYAPKQGDKVLLVPKNKIRFSGNGPVIKKGYRPSASDIVEIKMEGESPMSIHRAQLQAEWEAAHKNKPTPTMPKPEIVEPGANVANISPTEIEKQQELPAEPTTDSIIAAKMSKEDVEQMLQRFYNQNRDMWGEYDIKSWRDFLDRDKDTLDMELDSDADVHHRYLNRFVEQADEGNPIYPSDIIDAYKRGVLKSDSGKMFSVDRGKIENIPAQDKGTFWENKPVPSVDIKKVYEAAVQKPLKANKDVVIQARKDLFIQYNADPLLHEKLGITKAELNKKIRQYSAYPASASQMEMAVNQGVPEPFQWVGIKNLSWINRQSIKPEDVDKFFASIKIGNGGRNFYGSQGEMLRRYIINSVLGIDTRLLYKDLSFIINSLTKARGEYSPRTNTITISDINPNTITHELGHYLDWKFARELGWSNGGMSGMFDSINIPYMKEKYNMPDEHIAWAKKFYDFVADISKRSDISSEYTQRNSEVFARFVAKFVEWANIQAGVKNAFMEISFYQDKFGQSDYVNFIKLLQEKAYIDEKFGIRQQVSSTGEAIAMDKDVPEEVMKTGMKQESQDHPEIALEHPELIPQIVKDELKKNPDAYADNGEKYGKIIVREGYNASKEQVSRLPKSLSPKDMIDAYISTHGYHSIAGLEGYIENISTITNAHEADMAALEDELERRIPGVKEQSRKALKDSASKLANDLIEANKAMIEKKKEIESTKLFEGKIYKNKFGLKGEHSFVGEEGGYLKFKKVGGPSGHTIMVQSPSKIDESIKENEKVINDIISKHGEIDSSARNEQDASEEDDGDVQVSTPPAKPPVEPPTTAPGDFFPEDESFIPEGFKPEDESSPVDIEPMTEEEKRQAMAEVEVEAVSNYKNKHPLEEAMFQIGRIRRYAKGKEAEEQKDVPRRFLSNASTDSTADEFLTMLRPYGFNFRSESELFNALKELGDKGRGMRLSYETQKYLKEKGNVDKIEKALAKKLSPGAVRRIVNSYTGVKPHKTGTILATTEEQFLKWAMKERQKYSKVGYEAGKAEGKAQVRQEVKGKKMAEAIEREAKKRFTPQQRKELYQRAYSKGLILNTENGKVKNRLDGLLSYYKDATFQEMKDYISELQGDQSNPPKVLKLYGNVNADREALKLIDEFRNEWVDINDFEVNTLDPERIIEKVSGKDIWDADNILGANTYDVIAGAEAARFEEFNRLLRELHNSVGGMVRDTKVSSDAMRKAESGEKLTVQEQKAVDYIRSMNEKLFARANEARAKLGRKPIRYRQNYLTHMREFNLLMKMFKGDVDKIQGLTTEQLDAIRKSDFTKPVSTPNPHAKERKGPTTKYDLIGNYEKYLETMLSEIYLSPAIAHSRKFIEYSLLEQKNAYKAMSRLLDDIAGKPSRIDELLKPIVSNPVLKWIRGRIAANALIANINFNLVNAANITTNVGELGVYSLKGLQAFLGDKELRQLAFKHSSILQSRRSQFDADVKAISVFSPDSLKGLSAIERARVVSQQLRYLAEGLTRVIEYNNVGSTWCGAYMKGIQVHKLSPDRAMRYADSIAKKTQTGYRAFELPAIMRSDTGKLFLQFQSWTFNAMNYVIYDMKLGNIPKQVLPGRFNEKNRPGVVEYRKIIVLIGTLMLANEIYRRMGWREPTSLTSITPRVSFPVGRVLKDASTLTGADNLVKMYSGDKPTQHKPETMKKARTRLISSIAAPYGGAQISRMIEGSVLPKKDISYAKRDIVDMYVDAIKTRSKGKLAEADNEADRQGVLINDARKSAMSRIVGKAADVYEEALLEKSNKKLQEADALTYGDNMIKDRARKLAVDRIKDKRKKSEQLLEQQSSYEPKPERSVLQRAKELVSSW